METPPVVDVVIAVHTPERPVKRAVASVLLRTRANVRVNVVAHNIEAQKIQVELDEFGFDPRVRILSFRDNIPSPAGPKNYGLRAATAEFVSLLDSDDEFEPGAIDAWLGVADRADVIISRVRRENGTLMPAPPVRVFRKESLHGSRDRLSYRVGVWGGLIRRSTFAGLQFAEGLRTGEDQLFTAQLWFSGVRISYPVNAPGYVLHEDQADRVTATVPSVQSEFEYLPALLQEGRSWSQNQADRVSIAVRLLRMQVLDAYQARAEAWTADQAKQLAIVIENLFNYAPQAFDVLSVREASALARLRDAGANHAGFAILTQAQSRFGGYKFLMPKKWWLGLSRQAPMRTRLAGALLVRRR
ncbi:MAG: glycosyltransferase [Leucobacter sp.]